MRLIGTALLILILLKAADFLFVPVLTSIFWIKKKLFRMDDEKWNTYFNKISCGGYATGFLVIYLIPLILVCICGCVLMKFFDLNNEILYTTITFLLGILNAVIMLMRNKRKFLDLISKI